LKVNNQGKRESTIDNFTPFKTTAIRFQRTGDAPLRGGWFRMNEIRAWDQNGRRVVPVGARSDNYVGAWRSAAWAPEIFDDKTGWGNDQGIHFHNYVTMWYAKEVTIAKLEVIQAHTHGRRGVFGANSDWMWLTYGGGKFAPPAGAPTPSPIDAPPTGWELVHVNDQGAQMKTVDNVKPFTANAIRVQKARSGVANTGGWFRMTEIRAYDPSGNVIEPIGARSDNYHGAWRRSSWAPELFDGSNRWGDNTGIHFTKYATVWFAKEVTIAKLEVEQAHWHSGNIHGPQWNWMWLKHTGFYKDPTYDIDCNAKFSEWSTCSKSCGGGVQTQTWQITTPAKVNGECAYAAGHTIDQECNTNECPEVVDVEMTISETKESFTEDKKVALKDEIAKELGLTSDEVTITVGAKVNKVSRRLIESGLLITVTINVLPSKVTEEVDTLSSPAFATKVASATGITPTFKAFKPAHGSSICATCVWDGTKVHVTHYINAQKHGEKGLQHKCYHADGKCQCECM